MNMYRIKCESCGHVEEIPTNAFEMKPSYDYHVRCRCGVVTVLRLDALWRD